MIYMYVHVPTVSMCVFFIIGCFSWTRKTFGSCESYNTSKHWLHYFSYPSSPPPPLPLFPLPTSLSPLPSPYPSPSPSRLSLPLPLLSIPPPFYSSSFVFSLSRIHFKYGKEPRTLDIVSLVITRDMCSYLRKLWYFPRRKRLHPINKRKRTNLMPTFINPMFM